MRPVYNNKHLLGHVILKKMFYKSIEFLFLNVVDPMSYQTENRALTRYDNLYTEYNTYICINPEYSFCEISILLFF